MVMTLHRHIILASFCRLFKCDFDFFVPATFDFASFFFLFSSSAVVLVMSSTETQLTQFAFVLGDTKEILYRDSFKLRFLTLPLITDRRLGAALLFIEKGKRIKTVSPRA